MQAHLLKQCTKFLTAFCLLLHFRNGTAQDALVPLRMDVQKEIKNGHYDRALILLENQAGEVCRDTSGLFDAFIDLYAFEKRWSEVLAAYELHSCTPNEDTTTLSIARFASRHKEEEISLTGVTGFPFKRALGGSPIIDVKINGRGYHFWFDTGAGLTVLSSSTAKECGVITAGINDGRATAATGKTISMDAGIIDSLEMGGLKVKNHAAIILNRSDLEWRLLGIRIMKIDGIIGWNLLQEMDVTINNKSDSIFLATADDSEQAATNFFYMGVPLIQCADENDDSCLFTMDTGASNGGIYAPFLSRLAGKNGKKKKVIMSSAGGTKMIASYKIPSVKLKVSEKQVIIHDATLQPHGNNSLFPSDGVLGMRQFEGRTVHFNVRKGFFILTD